MILEKILMERDGLSYSEAEEMIKVGQNRVRDGDNPEDVLFEDFGLEPDYVFDLIEGM